MNLDVSTEMQDIEKVSTWSNSNDYWLYKTRGPVYESMHLVGCEAALDIGGVSACPSVVPSAMVPVPSAGIPAPATAAPTLW